MSELSGAAELNQFAELSEAQLENFARELQEMYRHERQLRQELEKEKLNLEQRLRELTALNQLFQQHLARNFDTERTYLELARGVQDLATGIQRDYHESALAAHLLSTLEALMECIRTNPPLSADELDRRLGDLDETLR